MGLKSLIARDPDEGHRAATSLELFYDLASVICIATAAAELHHAISHGHGSGSCRLHSNLPVHLVGVGELHLVRVGF